jgi:4-amino-4-deoxy-L-arabinose transferase-like glycosyltransferase
MAGESGEAGRSLVRREIPGSGPCGGTGGRARCGAGCQGWTPRLRSRGLARKAKRARNGSREVGPAPGRAARPPLLLGAVLLLALVLRLLALASLRGTIYFRYSLLDERIYHTWATALANGTWRSNAVYEFPPLPAYLMAAVYGLFSPDLVYIRYLNLILGVLTCFLVYKVGERLGDVRTGLLAALGMALCKPFILDSVVPLKTALFLALFALGLWLLVLLAQEAEEPRWGRALLLGITAALMLNVAGHALTLIPVFAAAVAFAGARSWRSWRRAGAGLLAFGAGLLLIVAPVAVRNHRVGGEWVLSTSQGGFNLYLGNRLDNPEPYYVPVPFASASPFEQGIQFTLEASRRAGHRLTPAEASRYWRDEVVKLAVERPAGLARKLGLKGLALFSAYERGDHYGLDFLGRFARFFALPLPGWGVLFPLGIAGLATKRGRSRRALWLVAASCAYGFTLILFFTNTRYREPLILPLLLLAALGLQDLFRAVKEKRVREIAAWLGVALGVAVLGHLPFPGQGDQTAYANTHALILDSKGRTAEAVEYWQESSRQQGTFSPFADLSLAGKWLGRRDFDRGLPALDRIADSSFAAAFKHELLGDVRVLQGDQAGAAAAYERSIVINGGRVRPREKLVWLLGTLDPARVEKEKADLGFVRSFYPPSPAVWSQ